MITDMPHTSPKIASPAPAPDFWRTTEKMAMHVVAALIEADLLDKDPDGMCGPEYVMQVIAGSLRAQLERGGVIAREIRFWAETHNASDL